MNNILELGQVLDMERVIKADDSRNSRVYFLINNNEIVYVGQTNMLSNRLSNHSDKEFDSVSFVDVDPSFIGDIEASYIAKFDPIYNKNLPPNSIFISKAKLRSELVGLIYDYFNSDKANVVFDRSGNDTVTDSYKFEYYTSNHANGVIDYFKKALITLAVKGLSK